MDSVDSDSDNLLRVTEVRKRNKRYLSNRRYEQKRQKMRKAKLDLKRKRHLLHIETSYSDSSTTPIHSSLSHDSDLSCDEDIRHIDSPDSDLSCDEEIRHIDSPDSDDNSITSHSSTSSSPSVNSCPSSAESSLDLSENSNSSLWSDLRKTVLETGMTEVQINGVLKTLRKHHVGPLPVDSRTLKKPIDTDYIRTTLRRVSGMEYFYFGYKNQILVSLARYSPEMLAGINELVIKDNVDGLPLYKSSSVSVWPLLAKIDNLKPSIVFPVLVTVGSHKPHDLDFLKEAITEMNDLASDGVFHKGKRLKIIFSAHICDTPARNMVKATAPFNAYYGCDYCEEKGMHDGKRMVWLKTRNLTERTDIRFRNRQQPPHHKSFISPYEQSQCDMILGFPIDFMHQGCGVMLKLLKWNVMSVSGHRRRHCRMSASNVKLLNMRLNALRSCIPNCFARLPRSTADINRYKATELRQILLYTCRIIFKGLMASDSHFHHLCALNAGCCLLVDPITARTENTRAEQLLISFCEQAQTLYGTAFMVYNVHSLLHLPRIAMVHGSLESVSAYNFESHLGILKRSIRSARHPIVSFIKRVYERQEANKSNTYMKSDPIIYKNYPNNFYVDLCRKKCYEVKDISGDSIFLREYVTHPYFRKPIASDVIGCFKVNNNHYNYKTLNRKDVRNMRRAMKIDLTTMPGFDERNTSVVMAMLHDGHELFP